MSSSLSNWSLKVNAIWSWFQSPPAQDSGVLFLSVYNLSSSKAVLPSSSQSPLPLPFHYLFSAFFCQNLLYTPCSSMPYVFILTHRNIHTHTFTHSHEYMNTHQSRQNRKARKISERTHRLFLWTLNNLFPFLRQSASEGVHEHWQMPELIRVMLLERNWARDVWLQKLFPLWIRARKKNKLLQSKAL